MAITVTATVEPSNVPPRVRLDVSASAGETATTITRINPDGTLVPVRTTDGNPLQLSGGTGLIYDYEVPFQQYVFFSSLETSANVSANVYVDISAVWLIHPGVPALSMPISLRPGTLQDETLDVQQGVYWPQGRKTPIVVSDGVRKGVQSQLIVSTASLDEKASLDALIADAGVVLLNIPATMNAGFDTSYIAPAAVKRSRWTDVIIDGNRDWVMPFYVVDRPAGGTQAERTLADLYVYASLADIKRSYATLHDVLAGP